MIEASSSARRGKGEGYGGWEVDVTPLKFSLRPWTIFTIFTNIYLILFLS